MTLNDIQAFLRENAARLRELGDRKDTSLGFNAFALVSDTYYLENFHSDIIRAILDPHSGHGEGALFLKKFVDFISDEARTSGKTDLADKLRGLVVDDDVEVVREEGRVDVKIKAPGWTIIVENKINGAGDMERQIPRYVEKCQNVVAVVYITAATKGVPSKEGWFPGDAEMVEPLLVHVIGFSETKSIRNLAEGWIGPCALTARGFHAKAILEQYAELLRHQSGETMNQDEIKSMLSSLSANNIQYTVLRRTLEEIPHTLAEHAVQELSGHPVVRKAWTWPAKSKTVTVLELRDIRLDDGIRTQLAIDVDWARLDDYGISFFKRSESKVQIQAFLPVLQSYDSGFAFVRERDVLTFDSDWVFTHVDEFIAKIRGLLDHLERNRERLEAICRGEASDAGC